MRRARTVAEAGPAERARQGRPEQPRLVEPAELPLQRGPFAVGLCSTLGAPARDLLRSCHDVRHPGRPGLSVGAVARWGKAGRRRVV